VYEDDQLLVVDKPNSMPVHACGSYRFNTLLSHLKYLYHIHYELANLHRIDKVTSGLVLLSKSKETFQYYQKQLMFNELDIMSLYNLKIKVLDQESSIQ